MSPPLNLFLWKWNNLHRYRLRGVTGTQQEETGIAHSPPEEEDRRSTNDAPLPLQTGKGVKNAIHSI